MVYQMLYLQKLVRIIFWLKRFCFSILTVTIVVFLRVIFKHNGCDIKILTQSFLFYMPTSIV